MGYNVGSNFGRLPARESAGAVRDEVLHMESPDHTAADSLPPAAVLQHLRAGPIHLDIESFPSLPSTNDRLKELAEAGAPEGKVLLSRSQTAGRGRMGRSFFSPAGSGIYMSLLLRPRMSAGQALLLTPMSALAVCEAIEEVCRVRAEIKWVNDILVGGKKVCGILTEAAFRPGEGQSAYVVLGIGVNVFKPEGGFPPALQGEAAYLQEERRPGVMDRLTAEILNRLLTYYGTFERGGFLEPYRERSCVLGREISVAEGGRTFRARAVEIDDRCALVIQTADGARRALTSGEIKIKL